jgi:hypothetical protein
MVERLPVELAIVSHRRSPRDLIRINGNCVFRRGGARHNGRLGSRQSIQEQEGFLPAMTNSPIDPQKLDKLGEVAIKVGLQLAEGQDLIITAPMTAAPLVRRITEHAYKAGAGLVTTIYSDEEATLMRFRHARDASFDRAAGWLYAGMAEAYKNNAARLAISGDNPMMLANEDPEKVSRANRANSAAYRPALELITGFDINSPIPPRTGPSWSSPTTPKMSRLPSWPMRSSRRRALTARTPLPNGSSTMPI